MRLYKKNAEKLVGKKVDSKRRLFGYYPIEIIKINGELYAKDAVGVCSPIPEKEDDFNCFNYRTICNMMSYIMGINALITNLISSCCIFISQRILDFDSSIIRDYVITIHISTDSDYIISRFFWFSGQITQFRHKPESSASGQPAC